MPSTIIGHPSSLFQFNASKDITILSGCGVGGSSLIDDGVALDCKASVFYDPVWPDFFREDLDNFKKYDRAYAEQMLRPRPYPDDFPVMKRINQLREIGSNLEVVDIEDLNEAFFRTPLMVNFEDAPGNHVGTPQSACNGCGNCMSGCNTGAKNTVAMNYIPDAVQHGAEVFTQVLFVTNSNSRGLANSSVLANVRDFRSLDIGRQIQGRQVIRTT